LPAVDAEDMADLMPADPQNALVAVATSGRRLGAAWWLMGGPPLVPVLPGAPEVHGAGLGDPDTGGGDGTARVAHRARGLPGHPALVLNVHLRNTAALRLYMTCGFHVAAAGRGWFGVAMSRPTTDGREASP